jgi:thiamine-phosphate pyrophosphorylase
MATIKPPRPARLPALWLLSDARNDGVLEAALRRLPRGSGFVYRHYHLDGPERLARFRQLQRVARSRGHVVVLADSALTAREWGAHGVYGAPLALWPRRSGLLQVATAHDMREMTQAARKRVDAVLLSPAFATRSHPGAPALGPVRWRLLAARSTVPVIALGGMTPRTARRLGWPCWAAIDGLS